MKLLINGETIKKAIEEKIVRLENVKIRTANDAFDLQYMYESKIAHLKKILKYIDVDVDYLIDDTEFDKFGL